ncbi:hypothetical protein LTR85_005844 [Meristemomyces frigidus]|nr:hypothetical protein LTR85_005844 [Meristemomyces frigidus]
MASINLIGIFFLMLTLVSNVFSSTIPSSASLVSGPVATSIANGASLGMRDINPAAGNCIEQPVNAIGDPNIGQCYKPLRGLPSDPATMLHAIDLACNGIVETTYGEGTNVVGIAYSTPDPNLPNQQILIKIRFTGDKTMAACEPYAFNYATCVNAFMVPVDACGGLGFFGQNYGGWAYDTCFEYTINNKCLTIEDSSGSC